MWRNIKTLFNFDLPATDEEIKASVEQFVRKLSGFQKPSKANEAVMALATNKIFEATRDMMNNLVTDAPKRSREVEKQKGIARALLRFGGTKT